jgi:hypothetical protein
LDAERKEGSRFEVAYPASTRVDAYKFHTYLNFHSPGTSKGKFINSTLNATGYHEAKDSEMAYFSDF